MKQGSLIAPSDTQINSYVCLKLQVGIIMPAETDQPTDQPAYPHTDTRVHKEVT